MKILLLGPQRDHLIVFLQSLGDEVVTNEAPLNAQSEILKDIDFIISYGFRHMIRQEVLDFFPDKVINFHISFLPWNRGADPNLWSFLEDSPKGVTIHYVDQGLDTGDILAQTEVAYVPQDTLRSMYERLAEAVENLFMQKWESIRSGTLPAFPQPEGGSFHRLSDREQYNHLLTRGWDTPVNRLIGKAGKGV